MTRILVAALALAIVALAASGCGGTPSCTDLCLKHNTSCTTATAYTHCSQWCAGVEAVSTAGGCNAQFNTTRTCEAALTTDQLCGTTATCTSETNAFSSCATTYCTSSAGSMDPNCATLVAGPG